MSVTPCLWDGKSKREQQLHDLEFILFFKKKILSQMRRWNVECKHFCCLVICWDWIALARSRRQKKISSWVSIIHDTAFLSIKNYTHPSDKVFSKTKFLKNRTKKSMVNRVKGLLNDHSHQVTWYILNVRVLNQIRCKSYWFSYNTDRLVIRLEITFLTREAKIFESIFASTLSRDIGLQFFI